MDMGERQEIINGGGFRDLQASKSSLGPDLAPDHLLFGLAFPVLLSYMSNH